MKCLPTERSQWQKQTPEIITQNEDDLVTWGKEEFQKLRRDLEPTLSTIQSKNEKLEEDFEMEQQWWTTSNTERLESHSIPPNELKHPIEMFPESRTFNKLKTEMLNRKEWKEKLLIRLGEFLEHYVPLPDRNVKTLQESTA